MKAILHGEPYEVIDDDFMGLELEHWFTGTHMYPNYGEPSLIIDPTDSEWADALEAYDPIAAGRIRGSIDF